METPQQRVTDTSNSEKILDKYYPTERTVFREAILKAMHEYAALRCLIHAKWKNEIIKERDKTIQSMKQEIKQAEVKHLWKGVKLVLLIVAICICVLGMMGVFQSCSSGLTAQQKQTKAWNDKHEKYIPHNR